MYDRLCMTVSCIHVQITIYDVKAVGHCTVIQSPLHNYSNKNYLENLT